VQGHCVWKQQIQLTICKLSVSLELTIVVNKRLHSIVIMLHVAQHPNNKIECFKIMKNVAQNKKHEVVGLEDWKDKRAKLGT